MKKNLNIVHVMASAGWGGGEKYAFELACASVREGMSVAVVSRPSEVIAAKTASARLKHFVLPLKGAADLVSAFRLARIIRAGKSDIIHVHNFKDAFTAVYAKLLSGRTEVKIIVTRHLVRRGKSSPLYRWLYRHVDKIIFVSHLARREFLEGAPPLPDGKTEVLYNSVEWSDANVEEGAENLRERYALAADAVLLGFTGRVVEEKGCRIVVEALAKLSDRNVAAVFVGAGSDACIEELRSLAQRQGVADRVFFYGYADNVPSLVRQFDIGLVPSLVREAFCLSAIEYMFAAKPVVATDNGAQQEYIRSGENGVLVPPADADALAAAIRLLIDDPALRRTIGGQARISARKLFAYERFRRQMMSLYAALADAGPVAGAVPAELQAADSAR